MSPEESPPGVTPLDHTADVGLEVEAATLPELFARAAEGMAWLIQGDPPSEASGAGAGPEADAPARPLSLAAADLPALLRAWLRELLFWHETEAAAFRAARFDLLTETRLEAEVETGRPGAEPVREIKGVTLHGLAAERRGDGWTARVIFDV